MLASFPPNESQRLAALRDYGILDSAREVVLDEVTELAARICNTPIALVSLIDHSRQRFKACVGLDVTGTERSVSFCAHAILQPGLFVVPDTLEDERFADNPFVTGPPHIRFYAGAPLFDESGHGPGTLCVVDSEPRELTPLQVKSPGVLRTHAMKLMELRRSARKQVAANRELEVFSYPISHDLRAPLRAVSGFTEILREDHKDQLDGEAMGLVEHILEAARRMDRMTRDLLEFSRLSHRPLRMTWLDLGEVAREVIHALDITDPGRGSRWRSSPISWPGAARTCFAP